MIYGMLVGTDGVKLVQKLEAVPAELLADPRLGRGMHTGRPGGKA